MKGQRISLFPLGGAVLYPGLQLPLHIFEPRYRALVSDALVRDRMIGMIQPREADVPGGGRATLYTIGCLGRITDVEALEDGRYNLLLEGLHRFRVLRELDVTTAFRQVEGERIDEGEDVLAAVERAALEQEARRFAAWLGYRVDWDGVTQLDDTTFVNAVAQVAPFDVASKQALLEADAISDRAELLMQMMRFATSQRDPGDNRATMQ